MRDVALKMGRSACSALLVVGLCWPYGLAVAAAPDSEGIAPAQASAEAESEASAADNPGAPAAQDQATEQEQIAHLEAVVAAAREAQVAGVDVLDMLAHGYDVTAEQVLQIDVDSLARIDEDMARQVADLQRAAKEELGAGQEDDAADDDGADAQSDGEASDGTASDGSEAAQEGEANPAAGVESEEGSANGEASGDAEPAVGAATGSNESADAEAKQSTGALASGKPADDASSAEKYPQWTYEGDTTYVPRRLGVSLTTEKFIAVIGEEARAMAEKNDLYASVMIAQAILESASGNSKLAQASNFNLFGVKGSYRGQSVNMFTQEDDGTGQLYTIVASFRKYPSYRASIADYVNLMRSPYYAPAHKSVADTPAKACDYLEGRYATSTSYSESLQDLIETYDLTRFDEPIDYELADEIWVELTSDELAEILGIGEADVPASIDAAWLRGVLEADDAAADAMDRARAGEGASQGPVDPRASVAVSAGKAASAVDDAAESAAPTEAEVLSVGLSVLSERVGCGDVRIVLSADGEVAKVEQSRGLTDLTLQAASYLGLPYQWGATGPLSFDCSGLVWRSYQESLDMTLPRTTYYMCLRGEDVDFADLRAGDLVFFVDERNICTHVGMYLGEGCYIESTAGGVQVTAMETRTPDFAKRMLPQREAAQDPAFRMLATSVEALRANALP